MRWNFRSASLAENWGALGDNFLETKAFMSSEIPKILHQTYSTRRLPRYLAGLRKGWLRNHPDWEHRFWTDADIRDFFVRYYPAFLATFDAYPKAIMRVDAFRYYLLYHYGGVYADLDYESLCPLDALLQQKSILLVPEPLERVRTGKSKCRGFSYVVSNALMASAAGHPFWKRVTEHLQIAKDDWDPLDATGPFMLTRAHTEFRPILPLEKHDHFELNPSKTINAGQTAYAVHHWHGSWWIRPWYKEAAVRLLKKLAKIFLPLFLPNFQLRAYLAKHPTDDVRVNIPKREKQYRILSPVLSRVLILDRGRIVRDIKDFSCSDAARKLAQGKLKPLVSALLITKERPGLAMRAVRCFLRQDYFPKELIVIDEGDDRFYLELKKINSPEIKYFRNEKATSLGALRNRAITLANGEYVCQWDDDDLYHPQKISYQLSACQSCDADACFLLREILYSRKPLALAISGSRLWEGTMLARKSALSRYPRMRRGEDYWAVHRLAKRKRVVILDFPELYIYTYHGDNTWGRNHFARVFAKSEHVYFLRPELRAALAELEDPYPDLSGDAQMRRD